MSALRIYSIALIGKHNQPLFVRGYQDENLTKWHYVAHCSLDIFEERGVPPLRAFLVVLESAPITEALAGKTVDSYLGMLYTMDDYSVYGYQTNTRTRIILVIAVTDMVVRDLDIKAIFRAVHTAYIQAVSNPFTPLPPENPGGLSAPIRSTKFEKALEVVVRAHNSTATML